MFRVEFPSTEVTPRRLFGRVRAAMAQVSKTGQALRIDLDSAEDQRLVCMWVKAEGFNVRQGWSVESGVFSVEIWPTDWRPHALPCPPGTEIPAERLPLFPSGKGWKG